MSEILTIENNLWEEKNLIEQKKNCSNKEIFDQNDTIKNTKKNVIENLWKDTIDEKNISVIYKIINKIDEKYYVGSSSNFKSRWRNHRSALRQNRHNNIHLQRAWNKYGENNFDFIIVAKIPESKKFLTEQKYLDEAKENKNKSYNLCWNAHPSGNGEKVKILLKGRIVSEKTRTLISEKNKIAMNVSGMFEKMSKIRKGKQISEEHKKILSVKCRNNTVFCFKNLKTNEIFNGTMHDFRNKTKIRHNKLWTLMTGKINKLKEWIFLPHIEGGEF